MLFLPGLRPDVVRDLVLQFIAGLEHQVGETGRNRGGGVVQGTGRAERPDGDVRMDRRECDDLPLQRR